MRRFLWMLVICIVLSLIQSMQSLSSARTNNQNKTFQVSHLAEHLLRFWQIIDQHYLHRDTIKSHVGWLVFAWARSDNLQLIITMYYEVWSGGLKLFASFVVTWAWLEMAGRLCQDQNYLRDKTMFFYDATKPRKASKEKKNSISGIIPNQWKQTEASKRHLCFDTIWEWTNEKY